MAAPKPKREIRIRLKIEKCEYCYRERVHYREHRQHGHDSSYSRPDFLDNYECICGPNQQCKSPMCLYARPSAGPPVK